MIFNMGGGAPAVNFKIISNPKPETAAENTIWINADVITGWEIAPALPEAMTEGMVWIEAGNSGEVCFNALKKNAILIFPLSAKQYSGGTWVDVEAQIYQDGAWKDFVDWSKWVVKNGVYKVDMVAEGKKYDPSYSETTFTVTEEDGYILFSHGSHTGMVYWGPVDLTDAETLTIEGDFSGINSSYRSDYSFAVWTEIGAYITTNRVAFTQLTNTGATLDVSSLTGKHYVGFTVRHTGSEKVTNLWME